MKIEFKIGRRVTEWEEWYAWRPVLIGKTLVWRETVQRRKFYGYNWLNNEWLYRWK